MYQLFDHLPVATEVLRFTGALIGVITTVVTAVVKLRKRNAGAGSARGRGRDFGAGIRAACGWVRGWWSAAG